MFLNKLFCHENYNNKHKLKKKIVMIILIMATNVTIYIFTSKYILS